MEPGTRIREYEMIRMLGRGGMAEVWLTSNTRMKGQYAIKFILDQFAGNADTQTRFVEEALKQSGLRHPNIVDVKTVFEENRRDYIVMEFVESGLDRRLQELRGQPLPTAEAVNITLQLLDALSYTHTLPSGPLIHRDIKPSNVLLKADGTIRLTDFGIALAANEARKTMAGQIIGTLFYMSPEQITTPTTVDHRTDIYSVGCVLYELLTGRPPFGKDGDTDYTIQHQHINRMPDPLRRSNINIPEQFEWVVLRSLVKDPNKRFQSCREMATALLTAYREAGQPLEELAPYPSWLGRLTPLPAGKQTEGHQDFRPTGRTVVEPPPEQKTSKTVVEPPPPEKKTGKTIVNPPATAIKTPTTGRHAPLPAKPGLSKGMAIGAVVLVVVLAAIGALLYSGDKDGKKGTENQARGFSSNPPVADTKPKNSETATTKPAISPSGRAFNSPLDVKLSDTTPGAQIYYTTDGSEPTTSSHRYERAIKLLPSEVDKQVTIRAMAVAEGYQPSPVADTTFVLKRGEGLGPADPSPADPNKWAELCSQNPHNTEACKKAGIASGGVISQGNH